VAIIIPTEPQMIEIIAPIIKAIAVINPYSVKKVITINMIKAKIKQIKYSCFKN
jgi:hypothetical protein